MSHFDLRRQLMAPLAFCPIRPRLFQRTLLVPQIALESRKTFAVLNRKKKSAGRNSKHSKARVQYTPLEDLEPIERYCRGGFHPVAIGDLLQDFRYRIVHKLGFSGYSTTWLAWDHICSRYVAIKIAASNNGRYDIQESDILYRLTTTDGEGNVHPGEAVIPHILDDFVLIGPNGGHRCLVTVPARMSLVGTKDSSYCRLFQPYVARAIIAQLVQAVDLLHSQGIVHADLHLGNILLRLPNSIDTLSPKQLYKSYGRPNLKPIERLDGGSLPRGVPTYGIVPIWLGVDSEDVTLPEAHIILSDFRGSFLPSVTQRHYSNMPPLLVPPEVRFSPQESLSFPADIWSLACAVWVILGQRPLFESFFATANRSTADHVEILGKLPSEWWERWETRLEWFPEEGEMKGNTERSIAHNMQPWEERFEYCVQQPRREKGMEEAGEEEKAALFAMLRSMFVFRPQERATAKEILGSEWMRKWALPDLEKMREIQQNGSLEDLSAADIDI